MNHHKFEKLFPELFDAQRRCGCSPPQGWENTILPVCMLLNEYRKTKLPELRVEQIKQKFADLRIYTTHDQDPYVRTLIHAAEAICHEQCEVCGQPAAKTSTKRGWIARLCEEHTQT